MPSADMKGSFSAIGVSVTQWRRFSKPTAYLLS
jgi:hypothetical protein